MVKLELKNNTILWSTNTHNWVVNYEELTEVYLSEKHPFTNKKLSKPTVEMILKLITKIGGHYWANKLSSIKNYKGVPLSKLKLISSSHNKLGSGKYATVYKYKDYAIKVINHLFYSNLPRIDGKVEASILKILQNKITYSYSSPNIITMYQFASSENSDYIVLEKLDCTLWSYLSKNPSEKNIKAIILQVLFALCVLQYVFPGFRHNDLKIDNILLDFTPRTQKICLYYKGYYWDIPKTVPLVKIADFDYASIPNLCKNPKVGTAYSGTFGCTLNKNTIYDLHIFLNSLYNYRRKLSPTVAQWLSKNLPKETRGSDTATVLFGRLRKPEQYEKIISTPKQLLSSGFFSEFRIKKAFYPKWGV